MEEDYLLDEDDLENQGFIVQDDDEDLESDGEGSDASDDSLDEEESTGGGKFYGVLVI